MDPDFDFMGFLMKNNRAVRHPLIVQAIEAIKSLPGISSIGAVGVLPPLDWINGYTVGADLMRWPWVLWMVLQQL